MFTTGYNNYCASVLTQLLLEVCKLHNYQTSNTNIPGSTNILPLRAS